MDYILYAVAFIPVTYLFHKCKTVSPILLHPFSHCSTTFFSHNKHLLLCIYGTNSAFCLFIHFFFLIINLFFIGVRFANIQNNTQCSSRQVRNLDFNSLGLSVNCVRPLIIYLILKNLRNLDFFLNNKFIFYWCSICQHTE